MATHLRMRTGHMADIRQQRRQGVANIIAGGFVGASPHHVCGCVRVCVCVLVQHEVLAHAETCVNFS